jgi:16S rRNA (cytosine967-C5)-methyltransferase
MHVIEVLMMRISPARVVALQTLEAVTAGDYASDALRRFAESLSPRDAGLASQIVFGCLRYQAQLDFLIEMYSGRKTARLDEPVLLALRTAIFQLRYLERAPPHAVVHDAVEWIKPRARSAAGLVNAVLRRVNREPVIWPDTATELSVPQWMLDRWTQHFGPEQARKIAEAALRQPTPYIRVPPGSTPPQDVAVETTDIPGALHVTSAPPRHLRLHDISSQAIVPLLGLEPGNSYLDLCAAPGNKTLQALEMPLGRAVACDVSFSRIRQIPPVCDRVVLDATVTLPFGRTFDRIFIDAPCSGTGTLGRNPEIKWRVKPEDLARFGEKQAQIAQQGARWLARGGTLVYATCSLETEENESVVRRILDVFPRLRRRQEMWRLPGRDEGDGFYAAVLQNFES